VCAITPIELEHTQYLGSTITLIAKEKAGIIKPGIPVCIFQPKKEASAAIEAYAVEKNAPCFAVGRDIEVSNVHIDRRGTRCILNITQTSPRTLLRLLPQGSAELVSPLVGAVYAQNMGLAALTLAQLPTKLTFSHIANGFAHTTMLARFEIVSQKPFVVLDGAHTPESIRGVLATFLELSARPRILLFACAADKRYEEMAAILSPHFEQIVITKPGTFKESMPELVFASFLKQKPESILIEDTTLAVHRALTMANARDASLLVTGSFYLCAEFKKANS